MSMSNTDRLTRRLRAEWRLKLGLTLALNVWCWLPYQWLQRHHYFPARELAGHALDHWIPFLPHTVWLYLSIYVFLPLPPLLLGERRQLLRYGAGFAAFSLAGCLAFLFWPTTCPRPSVADAPLLYRALTQLDNPFHAFPSLHAASALYTAACAERVRRELAGGWPWRVGSWLWTALILVATLTTKQHLTSDIIAGGALGLVMFHLFFRASPALVPAAPAPEMSGPPANPNPSLQ